MLPCLVCGTTLDNVTDDATNQPSEGTEFTTYGHYGSTFWDSMDGEEIAINVCDECLTKHTDRIARQKRYVSIVVDDPTHGFKVPTLVGRQWVHREMVPYFHGQEEIDQVHIEPEEIGHLPGFDHIEWVRNWREIKQGIIAELGVTEGTGSCKHMTFVAECTRCGAKPLEGLR